jgi:hypothetical protein
LEDKSPYVRGWSIQLALEDGKASPTLRKKFAQLAVEDPSPVVRLYLASGMQRLPLEQRWEVLEALTAHGEDKDDHNLPLMYWYAAEPLAGADASRALDLATRSKVPNLLPFMVRRISSSASPKAIALLVGALNRSEDAGVQLTILRGLQEGLKGHRDVPMPAEWDTAFARLSKSASADVRNQATGLAATSAPSPSCAGCWPRRARAWRRGATP